SCGSRARRARRARRASRARGRPLCAPRVLRGFRGANLPFRARGCHGRYAVFVQPSRASSGSERFVTVPAAESRAAERRIGVYELLAELGQGSSATVFLARAPKGDLVAVKVLKPQDAARDEARERFSREALIT